VRYFLDTNVVIDFLSDRKPFSGVSAQLFELGFRKKVELFISAVSYNNIYYILRQNLSHRETLKLLNEITDVLSIADVTASVIHKALKSEFKDFEDAIQYYSALSQFDIDAIVTRNAKDFRKVTIPILTPEEALSAILSASS
jgi:predicted nucleic acid-binding protein